MNGSKWASALALSAIMLGGCAASSSQVRVHTTTAAFEHSRPAQESFAGRVHKASRKESPRAQACRAGSSKACNELGDGLEVKQAHTDARQWYAMSCERVRGAMLDDAARLVRLSRDFARVSSDSTDTGQAQKLAALKSDLGEIRARLQGCLDTGDTLKADHEPKQALKYYDTVCEFSLLAEAVGDAMVGFQEFTENGCAAGGHARASLGGLPAFTPQRLADIADQARRQVAEQSAPQSAEGMVFSEQDL